ncbi:glycoside hydrolase [Herbaspirillum sp. RTI4]|uniref:glycoside hydrolase n=1 Tax=Herbaspirillum sp. RTI4 TaxID=3048640 RepID=UPI002AB3B64C|nr:glycoside hydrolase [Herbaspirillum sp. RTI4]MDY7578030.1 glycoside hydrolase [Herbaspirillum sp. RTI4]MEA9982040.1 glycoside hydrolase [Herbaspirillum sp. RTI4]
MSCALSSLSMQANPRLNSPGNDPPMRIPCIPCIPCIPFLRLVPLCLLLFAPLTQAITLTNAGWKIEIDPATLATSATLPSGEVLPISSPGATEATGQLKKEASSASWQFGADTVVRAQLKDTILSVQFTRTTPGQIQWPATPSGARGLILPIHEGYYVPANDKDWRAALAGDYSGINTTEDLSLPVLGMDYGKQVLSVLFANPFNNSLSFTPDAKGIGFAVNHSFTELDTKRPYEVQIALNGPDWLAPAKQYRQWLQARGEFVPLTTKLAQAKDGERLIGASHIYVWGERLFVAQDVKNWPALQKAIPPDWIAGGEGWIHDAAKKALEASDLSSKPHLQDMLVNALNQTLTRLVPGNEAKQIEQRKQLAMKTLGAALNPPDSWGDSNSGKMIHQLQAAGLSKLWIGLPQWTAGFASPEGIREARKAGYLIGPYDSYDTALPEGNDNPSWLSAQLGADAFQRCGIVLANGKHKTGFGGKGVYTNPACVRPLMEKRVPEIQAVSHYNSWFIDVDGTGMVFDDYDPAKRTSQAQDAKNRIAAMAWIAKTQGIIVGSEVGGAVANSSIAFAHGMQTSGFGWKDPDMRKDKSSPYYLGAWFPHDEPGFFFKTSSIKPLYQALYFDPAKRLPLFQAAFHDSVITTHHWTVDSLKFKETRVTTELLQQLYNVPPLLNMSLGTASKRIPYLLRLDAFFRPLHERLYERALTGFRWLTPEGQVQETQFSDGTRIIANFGDKVWPGKNQHVAAHSALATLPDGKTMRFQSN